MLKILNIIIKIGDKIYVNLAILCMLALIANITVGILARYVFRSPFVWTEELATMLFIWVAFLAAAVAAARKKFIVVDYFIAKIPPSMQDKIGIISNLLAMVLMVMIAVGVILLLPRMGHLTIALRVPRTIYYIPLFMSSVLIFLVQLESLLQKIIAIVGKNKQEQVQ